jgi:hypothetical protein
MKTMPSAFYDTSFKLNLADMVRLLFGKEVRSGCYVIGLWRTPDNGCTCESCSTFFKKRKNNL